MSVALVFPFGPTLYLLAPAADRPVPFSLGSAREAVRPGTSLTAVAIPPGLVDAIAALPAATELWAPIGPVSRALAARTGREVRPVPIADWRAARARLPVPDRTAERAYLRAVAAADLARALRSPEEQLVTLAREEERLERAVGRERRAAESLVEVPGSALVEYARRWASTREVLERHHAALVATVEAAAREVVPNLAAVVGPRVAARLVAAAGGVVPLGRMRAPRLQLLGSRRRPSADRGPRFGVIYRAERMDDVPIDRRGAYARSLAALAAIAVRADTSTRAPVAPLLLRRRERRIEQLRRRSR